MVEKNKFTDIRKNQILKLKNQTKILDFEKKFGQYLFLPLDIPKIEIKDIEFFKHWWNENSEISNRHSHGIDGEFNEGYKTYANFKTVSLAVQEKKIIRNINYKEKIFELFPEIREQIFEFFPIDKIEFSVIWQSVRHVSPHRDHFGFLDLPLSFRSMLYDENPNSTLYYKESLPGKILEYNEPVSFIPRLNTTNSWAWNNLRVKHGSNYNPNYKKFILLIEGLEHINWSRYDRLIEKSIGAFSEHLSVSNQKIEDFVNLEV
jgi:hypothetical protein